MTFPDQQNEKNRSSIKSEQKPLRDGTHPKRLASSSAKTKSEERKAVFIFGVVVVIVMLCIALFCPNPTPPQYFIFQTVLALAAAGIAAFIPGFLEVEVSPAIRAGGALAVFVLVFTKSPAALIVDSVVNIEAKPDTVNIAPNGYERVDYRFHQDGGSTIVIDAQDIRWMANDGAVLKEEKNIRLLGGSISLPKDGDKNLRDNVYLPPHIAEKASELGVNRVNLETTFYGTTSGQSKSVGRAILSINILPIS